MTWLVGTEGRGRGLVTRMELQVPVSRRTVTAATNIYLLLSLLLIQAVGAERPRQLPDTSRASETNETRETRETRAAVRHARSLDSYYYYDTELGPDQGFRPSVKFESRKEAPVLTNSHSSILTNSHSSGHRGERHDRHGHFRPERNNNVPRLVRQLCSNCVATV